MSRSGATKTELRKAFLAQRRALSVPELEKRSRQIADQLFSNGFPSVLRPGASVEAVANVFRVCHIFLPIKRNNEVDTWPIIHRLWQAGPSVRVAVPITDTETNQLTHRLFTAETLLVENRWGIPEPVDSQLSIIGSQEIDVVLVPLLAFDRTGHRVGYGRGYYDSFLAECRPDCPKIGLSFFEPVDRVADIEPTDVRLDACVAPEHTYFF